MKDNGFKEYRHFGGTRVVLRTEYKAKFKGFDIDLSKEAFAANIEIVLKRNRERFGKKN